MVQELTDLKKSILEERYQDALEIIDELELIGNDRIDQELAQLPGGKDWFDQV